MHVVCVSGHVVNAYIRENRLTFTLTISIRAHMFPVPCTTGNIKCGKKPWWYRHVLRPLLAESKMLFEDMHFIEVTKCPHMCPAGKMPHIRGPLTTHILLGDILPLWAKGLIYGVAVKHNLHIYSAA